GETRCQVRVLAPALRYPAPPRIVRDVHHRGERPVDAVGAAFRRGYFGVAGGHRRVETGALRDGNGEGRPKTVDDVEPEQQRDAQSRFLDGDPLQVVGALGAVDVQHRAQPSGAGAVDDLLHLAVPGAGVAVAAQLLQLAELLLDRHLLQQPLYSGFDRGVSWFLAGQRFAGHGDRGDGATHAGEHGPASDSTGTHIDLPSLRTGCCTGTVLRCAAVDIARMVFSAVVLLSSPLAGAAGQKRPPGVVSPLDQRETAPGRRALLDAALLRWSSGHSPSRCRATSGIQSWKTTASSSRVVLSKRFFNGSRQWTT